MRVGNGFAAALVVAAVGTIAPGCEGDTEAFGRICAAPFGGGTACVPAEKGPATAWQQAEAEGEPPIEMWVERPEEMTLDDLVKSEQNLTRWFATVDEVIEYVRDTQRNAESYKLTLEGRLGMSLRSPTISRRPR
jgi:hypothetical protein